MVNILLVLMLVISPVQDQYRDHTVTDVNGRTLDLRYYSPPFSGAPTVIICHEWGGSIDTWSDIARSLKKLGFGVVLYSQRGHGNGDVPYYLMAKWQVESMHLDLNMAIDFAVKNSGQNVFVIGAGMGANIAMKVASEDLRVKKVVAISPGLNYKGFKLHKDMTRNLENRLMMVASQEDVYSMKTINLFTSNSEKPAETSFYSNSGRGVWILKRQPESLATVARWLSDTN